MVLAALCFNDKRAINLYKIDRQLVQTRERRVASAKVVQRQGHAQGTNFVQGRQHQFILRGQALGHLQYQLLRCHTRGAQRIQHIRRQTGLAQLGTRQIDGNGGGRPLAQHRLQRSKRAAGGLQHKQPHRADQTARLGHRDELHR